MITEKMKPEEKIIVSAILTQAFYSKFSSKVGMSTGELQIIISEVWLGEAEAFGIDVWTVKKEGRIVGAYGLSAHNKHRMTLSLLGKLTAVIRHLGLRKLVKLLKVLLETNRKLEENELYVEFVAVRESHRGQNIGHFIMESIKAYAAVKEGVETLTLFVLKDNDRARHVYEKFGFRKRQDVKSTKYDFMALTLAK